YGGRSEIADAAAAMAADAVAGRLRPDRIDEKVLARYLDEPGIPDVDLFVRSSGEQRLSNFLIWQSAYAELVFLDTLFPDFDPRPAAPGVRAPPPVAAGGAHREPGPPLRRRRAEPGSGAT